MMRGAVIESLLDEIGHKHTMRAVSALDEVIEDFGGLMQTSLQALWDAMLLNKMSLDFFVKMKIVFNGFMEFYDAQTKAQDGMFLAYVCLSVQIQ
jgi:hypothetical protein